MQRMNSGLSQPGVASCSTVWGYGDGYPPQMISDCGGGYLSASLSGQRELGVTPAAPPSGLPRLLFPGADRRSIKPGVPLSRPLAQNCLQNHLKVRFPLMGRFAACGYLVTGMKLQQGLLDCVPLQTHCSESDGVCC